MSLRILLYHLPVELSRELRDTLIASHLVPAIEDEASIYPVAWDTVDVVFCRADRPSLTAVLAATTLHRPRLRIIATSRLPGTEEWLDAVESGATDYCAQPFENTQIRWLLESHFSKKKPIAA